MEIQKIAEHAKHVVQYMIRAENPTDGMLEIVKAFAADETISGNDLIRIFGASIVFMAKSMDRTAQQALGGVTNILTLLYPGKTPEELLTMAAAFLAGEDLEDAAPRVRVVVMHMRGDE